MNATSVKTNISVPFKFWFDVKKNSKRRSPTSKRRPSNSKNFAKNSPRSATKKTRLSLKKKPNCSNSLGRSGKRTRPSTLCSRNSEAFKTQREQELALVVASDSNEAETGLKSNVKHEYELDGLPTPSGKGRPITFSSAKTGRPSPSSKRNGRPPTKKPGESWRNFAPTRSKNDSDVDR